MHDRLKHLYNLTDQIIRQQRQLEIRDEIIDILLAVPNSIMFSEVAKVIARETESEFASFGYINKEGSIVNLSLKMMQVWDKCNVGDKKIVFTKEDTLKMKHWGTAYKEKRTCWTNEECKVPEGHLPIYRVIVTPIIFREELVGIFAVANKKEDYTRSDVNLLEMVAHYIAPTLKARLTRDRQMEEVLNHVRQNH